MKIKGKNCKGISGFDMTKQKVIGIEPCINEKSTSLCSECSSTWPISNEYGLCPSESNDLSESISLEESQIIKSEKDKLTKKAVNEAASQLWPLLNLPPAQLHICFKEHLGEVLKMHDLIYGNAQFLSEGNLRVMDEVFFRFSTGRMCFDSNEDDKNCSDEFKDMVNLTKTWANSGGDPSNTPLIWLNDEYNAQYLRVVEEKNATQGCIKFRGSDLFAHPDIGIAYAQFLSPAFHIWCLEKTLEAMTTSSM